MGNPSDWFPEVKKGFFRIFQKKLRKIMVFQWKNENWPKTVKKSRKCSKLFPDIICYCFYDMSTLEPDLGRFRPFLGHFRRFWLTCFRPKSRRPRRENFYFLGQILFLQTQTYVWIPSTHPAKYKRDAEKLTFVFWVIFSTWNLSQIYSLLGSSAEFSWLTTLVC